MIPGAPVRAARGAAALAVALCLPHAAFGATPHRYLVLPFENVSAERSLNWIGEALALGVADRLELMGLHALARAERLDAMEAAGVPDGKAVTLATTLKIVAAARADRFVTGTFRFDPKSGVTVTYRLFDAGRATEISDGTRSGALSGVFSLTDPLVAEAVGRDLDGAATALPPTLASFADPPLPIYEAMVRALLETEPERRLSALQKALEMDHRSGPVRRYLALEQIGQGQLPEALASLEGVAAESSPDGWRVNLLRARILAAQGNLDGATAALARSIAARDTAEAHLLLARLSATRGDAARAAAEIDLAAGLDPTHPELDAARRLVAATPPKTL
ncbi:MAG TPA: tetratricopeptide repeat protein [Verrucomicrobiae bacterium]|nr:tetratricopeptide repeat protein [Verrucomicrobiae bacterium]